MVVLAVGAPPMVVAAAVVEGLFGALLSPMLVLLLFPLLTVNEPPLWLLFCVLTGESLVEFNWELQG